jgi:RNA polymerase sigma-70 factor, ECF subfamily
MNDLLLTLHDAVVSFDEQTDSPTIAFAERLAGCSALMFRVAYSVVRHREDAEDIAQEALLRACSKQEALRRPESLRFWLVRICWRLALDHRRAAGRRLRRQEAAAEQAVPGNAEDAAAGREFQERLRAAIDRLPQKLRIVLLLAAIEGHTVAEVARLLELPEGTVKSRLSLARRRLLEVLR